jgi:plasmid maintenance system antidote protein VapI
MKRKAYPFVKEKTDNFNIPPVELTEEEQAALKKALQQVRREIDANTPEDVKKRNRFLQLRHQMKTFLEEETDSILTFGFFLQEYINRTQKKNKELANEISIHHTELSQVINRKRKPSEKLIFRLDIHSNQLFPASLWFAVLEKERRAELKENRLLIEQERPFVKSTIGVEPIADGYKM